MVVVVTALPARLVSVPWGDVLPRYPRFLGKATLYRILAILLTLIAVILVATHVGTIPEFNLPTAAQLCAGLIAGLAIGVVAALMGVAGGELIIPTIVLLYGIDIKIAGTLSLAVSLPTMLVAFARYSRDASFQVLRHNLQFLVTMAAGSVLGTIVGGLLLGIIPSGVLIPALAVLVVVSAVKVWRHR